ncbi:MAG: acyltransferase family protein [Lachnospiraceae bacterium]|nr:acyltransferase family protein [Lachnospiraceae bacterium]
MEQTTTQTDRQREYLFDNYKVLLIILVVIGHFIEPNYEQNPFLYELKWGIVAFHMPAFIFISGYFSKKIPSIKKMISGLIIPYFVYEILYYLLYTFILDKETGLYFTRPKFSLWYLMALFAWRILAPYVQKIPGKFALSIAAGLLIGLTNLDNFLSIPRIVFFFPFFLAGLNFDSSRLTRFRNRKGYIGALTILGALAVFLFTDECHHSLTPQIFYGRYSYHDLELGNPEGILIRILCYAVSFLLIYLFMLVLPTEKKSYSYLGERTMAIYIFHGFIYSCLKYGSSVLSSVESNLESILLLGFCLFLVWLLSRKPFVAVTNKIAHLF